VRTAQSAAASFADLDPTAHSGSKLRARAAVLADFRRGIDSELGAGSTDTPPVSVPVERRTRGGSWRCVHRGLDAP
jgi:hypothetical protein